MPAEQIIGIRRQVEVDQAEDRFRKVMVRYEKTSFSLEIKETGAGVTPAPLPNSVIKPVAQAALFITVLKKRKGIG